MKEGEKMATIMLQTPDDSNVIEAFVEAVKACGHIGTGWTGPTLNPMIKVNGIEVSDFGNSGEQLWAG